MINTVVASVDETIDSVSGAVSGTFPDRCDSRTEGTAVLRRVRSPTHPDRDEFCMLAKPCVSMRELGLVDHQESVLLRNDPDMCPATNRWNAFAKLSTARLQIDECPLRDGRETTELIEAREWHAGGYR